MDSARLLDEALAAWACARAGVADEVESLSADRCGFRPAPESRSVAERRIRGG